MTQVLIVDDQEQNLYLLQVLLQAQGYTVRSANNGIEALEMARREVPDLIITDILMPGMDGFSLCRAWMADEGLRQVPLVFYTATYTDPRDEAFALSLGAARFIVKPAEPDIFAEIVRQVLADHAVQQLIPIEAPTQGADGYYQQYNATLIRKLEDKMTQLEQANRSLERDIAERKQTEEALRESEERFRAIASNTPDHILMQDSHLRYVFVVNPQLGLTEADMIGKTDYDFLSKEEGDRLTHVKEQVLATGTPVHFRPSLVSRSGEAEFFDGTYVPHYNAQGQVDGLIGYFRNVTERKRVEQALSESEARYRNLLDVAPVGIAVHSEGKIVFANPAGARLLGADSAEQIIGKPIAEIIHPDWLNKSQARIARMMAGEKGLYPAEDVYLRIDGTPVNVEVTATPLPYKGKPAVQVIVSDITERQQAEEERQRYTSELRTIYEAARELQRLYTPDQLAQKLITIAEQTLHYEFAAVLLIDEATGELIPFALSDQGRGSRFVEADKAYVSGHRIAVGKGITGLVAQTGQPMRVGDVRSEPRYVAVRDSIRSELCVPLRAGDVIIGVLNVESPTEDAYSESDQRVLETVAAQMALAIEQARLHQQVQRHAAELEQRVNERTAQLAAANQEMEAFAYSVSHDLRAPLRALSGFSAILLSDNNDQLDEQGKHYLQRIQEAAQRMGQLIEDLLDLSRITRRDMSRQPVDLSALAQEIAADLQERAPQRQAEFIIAPHMIVNGDQHLLRIAMDNLMNNAWKFSGPRTLTQIEVGRMTIQEYQSLHADTQTNLSPSDIANPQAAIYYVRDNGVGFDMAYAGKLFAPFHRLHGLNEFPGTGIGLVTVQRIIVRHGGRVWPEAVIDQGATFYFTLGGAEGE